MIPHASAAKVLLKELKNLTETPLEGFQILNAEECNVYEWDIAIFGPPNTQFAGGYFKAKIKFPGDYPFNPPSFRFQSKVFHPNIYENGEVCISILHPPSTQVQGGELPEERWSAVQSVRTVVMSIISLLSEPNIYSPANVDASVMYRDHKAGKPSKWLEKVNNCIHQSRLQAVEDGVEIPDSVEAYTKSSAFRRASTHSSMFALSATNLYDDYEFESEEECMTTEED